VISFKYMFWLTSLYGHFLKAIQFYSNDKSCRRNYPHDVVLYPKNGDGVMTVDSVTSLHPMSTTTSTTTTHTHLASLSQGLSGEPVPER